MPSYLRAPPSPSTRMAVTGTALLVAGAAPPAAAEVPAGTSAPLAGPLLASNEKYTAAVAAIVPFTAPSLLALSPPVPRLAARSTIAAHANSQMTRYKSTWHDTGPGQGLKLPDAGWPAWQLAGPAARQARPPDG